MPLLDNLGLKLTSPYLNDANDPAPGMTVASSQVSGSIIPSYLGQVGARVVLDADGAAKVSKTSIGTLYGGVYQYVQVLSSATANPARGALCYWSNRETYVVTTDQIVGNESLVAGVFLNPITKGNYGFIQIYGKASLLFKSTITKGVPAQGDLVVVDGATSPRGDVLADATALTSPLAKLILGTCLVAPISNAISLVELWSLRNAV